MEASGSLGALFFPCSVILFIGIFFFFLPFFSFFRDIIWDLVAPPSLVPASYICFFFLSFFRTGVEMGLGFCLVTFFFFDSCVGL